MLRTGTDEMKTVAGAKPARKIFDTGDDLAVGEG